MQTMSKFTEFPTEIKSKQIPFQSNYKGLTNGKYSCDSHMQSDKI